MTAVRGRPTTRTGPESSSVDLDSEMELMTRDAVLDLLKGVKYPGFSRDIVSFGIVKEILLERRDVSVQLEVTTTNPESQREIETKVREVLHMSGHFGRIDVAVKAAALPKKVAEAAGSSGGTIPGVRHVMAVASGKGGVGKSTVAVNIAAALALDGLRTGILDLDIYGPSLPILLGIHERPQITEERKLIPLEKFGMKTMSFGFISGNDAPTIWRGPMVSRMTEQFFHDVLWGELDYLVLDLPPGTGDIQLTLVQKLKISGAIIVTTPQDLALADVRKGADMFRKVNAPVLGVVENMAGFRFAGRVTDSAGRPLRGGAVTYARLDDAVTVPIGDEGEFAVTVNLFKKGGGEAESARLHVPLLAQIPLSLELMESCDSGTPIVVSHPDSEISSLFQKIARSLSVTVPAA